MRKLAVLCLSFVLSFPARAHMHDRPDLDDWFKGLANTNGGPCCSGTDATTIADVDWDTVVVKGKNHYRVRVEDKWIVVTDAEVVEGPNKYRRPLAWIYHTVQGEAMVRCFMPGAGG